MTGSAILGVVIGMSAETQNVADRRVEGGQFQFKLAIHADKRSKVVGEGCDVSRLAARDVT